MTNYINSVRDALDTPGLRKKMDQVVYGGLFESRISAAAPRTVSCHSCSADKQKLLPPPFLHEKLPLGHQNHDKETHYRHAPNRRLLSGSVTQPRLHHSPSAHTGGVWGGAGSRLLPAGRGRRDAGMRGCAGYRRPPGSGPRGSHPPCRRSRAVRGTGPALGQARAAASSSSAAGRAGPVPPPLPPPPRGRGAAQGAVRAHPGRRALPRRRRTEESGPPHVRHRGPEGGGVGSPGLLRRNRKPRRRRRCGIRVPGDCRDRGGPAGLRRIPSPPLPGEGLPDTGNPRRRDGKRHGGRAVRAREAASAAGSRRRRRGGGGGGGDMSSWPTRN
ncbi:uncharacterized protein FN964_001819 [Alca torda]